MKTADKLLIAVYALIAVIALFATWSNNLAFLAQADSGGLVGFIRASYANRAAASIANDIALLCVSAFIFMIGEARRLGIRFVWIYIVLSLGIAVSVMFPLFMIARQIQLVRTRPQTA